MSNVNLNETAPTQFQDIGGVSLAYRHFGKEGAPPVVCFQHFTGTMNNFDPIHTNRRTGVRDGAKDHPLECATMLAHVAQLTLPHELEQVMDTITVNSARLRACPITASGPACGPIWY